jgi:hypothetical protein
MGDGGFYEKLGQVRREIAYSRWRQLVATGFLGRGTGNAVQAVLDMLVGEPVGFTIVATRYGMGNGKARQLLIDALNLWPMVLGGVVKEVDQKDLDRAHARFEAWGADARKSGSRSRL